MDKVVKSAKGFLQNKDEEHPLFAEIPIYNNFFKIILISFRKIFDRYFGPSEYYPLDSFDKERMYRVLSGKVIEFSDSVFLEYTTNLQQQENHYNYWLPMGERSIAVSKLDYSVYETGNIINNESAMEHFNERIKKQSGTPPQE